MHFSKATLVSLFLAGVNAYRPGFEEAAISKGPFTQLPSGAAHPSGPFPTGPFPSGPSGRPSGVASPSGWHHGPGGKGKGKGKGKSQSGAAGAPTSKVTPQPTAPISETTQAAPPETTPKTNPETSPEDEGPEKRQEFGEFQHGHQRHNTTGGPGAPTRSRQSHHSRPTATGSFSRRPFTGTGGSFPTPQPGGDVVKAGGCDSLVSAGVALSCATNKAPAPTATGGLDARAFSKRPVPSGATRAVCYTQIAGSFGPSNKPIAPQFAPCYKVDGKSEATSVWSLASSLAPTPSAAPEDPEDESPTPSESGSMSIQTSD